MIEATNMVIEWNIDGTSTVESLYHYRGLLVKFFRTMPFCQNWCTRLCAKKCACKMHSSTFFNHVLMKPSSLLVMRPALTSIQKWQRRESTILQRPNPWKGKPWKNHRLFSAGSWNSKLSTARSSSHPIQAAPSCLCQDLFGFFQASRCWGPAKVIPGARINSWDVWNVWINDGTSSLDIPVIHWHQEKCRMNFCGLVEVCPAHLRTELAMMVHARLPNLMVFWVDPCFFVNFMARKDNIFKPCKQSEKDGWLSGSKWLESSHGSSCSFQCSVSDPTMDKDRNWESKLCAMKMKESYLQP